MLRQKAHAIMAAAAALVAALALSLSLGTAPSGAAKAPADFFGVVPQTALGASDFERMGNGKVGSLRTILQWAAVDPTSAPDDLDWASFDPIMLEAARNGIEILPFIYATPEWVAKGIDGYNCTGFKCYVFAPKKAASIEAFKTFVGEVVDRYGPNGEFWALHPEVPKNPIDTYQILNEQNSETFFAPKPSPKLYAKILAAAADAIRTRDAGADIVLGGMAELSGSHKAIIGSKYLADFYKISGVEANFDGIAPHPYGASVSKVASQVEKYRKVLKKAHDSGADMYVTEVGAGSATGGSSLNRGKTGQAKLLTDIFKYFMKKRNSFNVQEVDWFSWMDAKQSICSWCKTSGLLTKTGKTKPSYKAFTKLTGGSTK